MLIGFVFCFSNVVLAQTHLPPDTIHLIDEIRAAAFNKNISFCESLNASNERLLCKLQIALHNKDKKLCSSLNKTEKRGCIKTVAQGYGVGPRVYEYRNSLCWPAMKADGHWPTMKSDEGFEYERRYKACIMNLARKTDNSSLCELIPTGTGKGKVSDSFSKDACMAQVSFTPQWLRIIFLPFLTLIPLFLIAGYAIYKTLRKKWWIGGLIIVGLISGSIVGYLAADLELDAMSIIIAWPMIPLAIIAFIGGAREEVSQNIFAAFYTGAIHALLAALTLGVVGNLINNIRTKPTIKRSIWRRSITYWIIFTVLVYAIVILFIIAGMFSMSFG